MPPRGSNTARMQLGGLSKARPISWRVCSPFQRPQTLRVSLAESPKRITDLMTAPPSDRFTSDGVASTCRMHRVYPESGISQRFQEHDDSFLVISFQFFVLLGYMGRFAAMSHDGVAKCEGHAIMQ